MIGLSDDYISINVLNYKIYYGYEYSDAEKNEPWYFIAHKAGEEIMKFTAKQLGAKDQYDVMEVFLLGMAKFIVKIEGE